MLYFNMPSNLMSLWYNFFSSMMPIFTFNKPKPVDHLNGKYKVTRTTIKKDVFYTNSENKDEAEEEGWRAFGIYKEGVISSIASVSVDAEENPHRMVDDDGYDTVTGIKRQ